MSCPQLRVSENRRYLVREDGTPFFYLGDTAWELFHRLTGEQAQLYLEDRAGRGFTVIQAVALAEMDGLHTPNVYGATPLLDDNPGKPLEEYWQHVDRVIDMAAARGLYMGLLPTWGDKVRKAWGIGPVVFDVVKAREYGRWIGRRYEGRPNIIWILGGDRGAGGYEQVWNAMAEGIRSSGSRHLMTYHPWGIYPSLFGRGGNSSSLWFHRESWLDFNMMQSSHFYPNQFNYRYIMRDYGLEPAKPCMDGEPNYEDHVHVIGFGRPRWFTDYDVRKSAYWSVFAGAHGYTYGNYSVCLFISKEKPLPDVLTARRPVMQGWQESLERPGASQMIHLRRLMESRPFLTRIPDQAIIVSGQRPGGRHIQATRSAEGSYVMVYVPRPGQRFTLDLRVLHGDTIRAWWYNTRTGSPDLFDEFVKTAEKEFTSPHGGPDHVLVLDDASSGFQPPGHSGGISHFRSSLTPKE